MRRNKSVILNLFQDLNGMLKQVQHDRIAVILLLVTASFLRFYRLDELMPFIGDFAWFYLSARDMLLTGNIPLVGIASSHTWVHQGPLWTYLLALPLFISNFNPLSGAYFTAALGTLTVFMVYRIGTQMFSRFVGLAAAALYATSPLVVIHARMPYHTSLIPLVSILFILFLYKWIKGDIRFLPFIFFTLGILYNLELATMVFWILLMIVLFFGIIRKEIWFTEAINPKIILLSVFLFLLPMLPMVVYDFKENTGFYQTTAFLRLIKIYLFSGSYVFSFEGMRDIFSSLFTYNERLVFLGNGAIALLLTLISFAYLFLMAFRIYPHPNPLPKGEGRGEGPLLLWVAIPLSGIILSKTASEAYVPMLFPAVIFSIALFLNYIYKRNAFIVVVVVILVIITNSYLIITRNYLMDVAGGYGLPFSKRVSIAKEILKKSRGREYNIIGKGRGSEHKSFTMNYEYLTWWLGHPPSKNPQNLVFIVDDSKGKVIMTKSDRKL